MCRDIRITETSNTQLNTDKFTPQQKPNFIECLQRSIANLKGESNDDLQRVQRKQTKGI